MTSFENTTFTEKIDVAIEAVLYGLLAFMPFAFGVVHAWSELIFILAATVLIGLQTAKFIITKTNPILPWALMPVLVFIMIPVFQLIPLPPGVVKALSPNTYIIKTDLLSKLPDLQSSVSSPQDPESSINNNKMRLSFYSHTTWRGLRVVLSVAAIFFVTLQQFTTVDRIKRLLACIAIVGAVVALLAILQDITRAEKIYWTFSSKYKMATAGPFVNYSNFSQFMNLSIGASLALIFINLHEAFDGKQTSLNSVADYMSTPAARPVWLLTGMVLVGVTSVFASLSRAGMISLLTAGTMTTIALTLRKSLKGRGWLMAFMALGAFICVLYVGFDAVYDRLATLRELDKAQGGRIQIIKDIAVAWSQFPVFGTGLDTHAVVYPMFDRATISALAAHADSDYAQAFEEVGLLGVVSLLVFAGFLVRAYWNNIRTAHVPLRSAAYGLGFGLIAILIHSGTDFGQHLPANATVTAIFCALLISLSPGKKPSNSNVTPNAQAISLPAQNSTPGISPPQKLTPKAYTAMTLSAILTMVLLSLIFTKDGAWAAKHAEKAYTTALRSADHLESVGWSGTTAQYTDLLRQAQKASELQPENIEYRHWLNVWRWRSMSRYTDPNGIIIMHPQAMAHVRRLVDEYTDGLKVCPTYGPSWTVAGQLLHSVLQFEDEDSQGASMIRTGYELAPYDATVCFVNGLLEVEEDQKQIALTQEQSLNFSNPQSSPSDEAGYSYFERAIELDSGFFDEVAQVYLSIDRPDLAVRLASDNVSRLNALAQLMVESEQYTDVAQAAKDRVIELLEKQTDAEDVQPWTLASLASVYTQDGRLDEAIALYTRALTYDYGNISWRFSMARCLVDLGETEQAIHQCRICLRVNPTYAPAKRLIEQLSIRPVTVNP